MKEIYIVRFYFYDGDGYEQYRDIDFFVSKEAARRKCDELNSDEWSVGDEYHVVRVELSNE